MLPFVASMPGGNVKTLLKHLNSASFAAKARLIKAFASHSGARSYPQAHDSCLKGNATGSELSFKCSYRMTAQHTAGSRTLGAELRSP
jgi:hypothetical protein